jgi:hypothetical protein
MMRLKVMCGAKPNELASTFLYKPERFHQTHSIADYLVVIECEFFSPPIADPGKFGCVITRFCPGASHFCQESHGTGMAAAVASRIRINAHKMEFPGFHTCFFQKLPFTGGFDRFPTIDKPTWQRVLSLKRRVFSPYKENSPHTIKRHTVNG